MTEIPLEKPELVIGLVGAAGTELKAATDALVAGLAPYGYSAFPIRVSALMPAVKGGAHLEQIECEDDRIIGYMDAGDEIRNQSKRNDALAALAVSRITEYRAERSEDAPAANTAFILDSLKHPAEIESMRSIYRDRFVLVSVHSTTEARRQALKQKIARSHGMPERPDDHSAAVKQIMARDEHDDDHDFGQNVREAFVLGDVYVSTQPESELPLEINRFLRLLFGDPFCTPTKDEYAMFQTHTAALRSADLSRQVGAAVCTDEGEIVAVGCNEVPKANGGQYWPDDERDFRDFMLGYDSNVKYRNAALGEAFRKLAAEGWVSTDATEADLLAALKGSRLANLTEFGRPVHAEMAALLDAARRGVAVANRRLFATTFPCHNCARHIVAAGIKEVVYREPYEKSLASELHRDSIVVDPTTDPGGRLVFRRFVGVGPPKYLGLFTMKNRKDELGNRLEWTEGAAIPKLVTTGTAYLTNEEDFLDDFYDDIERVDLSMKKGEKDGSPQRLA